MEQMKVIKVKRNTLKFILVLIGFTVFLETSAQIKREFEIKVTDAGLYFNGKKRTSSSLNTNEAGFDFYFGRRITPHGDCIKKHGDFLFLSWYLGGEANKSVMLSRLHIPTQTLETIEFSHTHVGFRHKYSHIGDSHNTIAVGICPLDSTVHLLYDMHSYSKNDFPDSYFNYQVSLKGAAAAPVGSFTIDLFKPRQTYLNPAYNYSDITYPNFFLNTDNELFVWFREGGNNNGMYKFAKYDGNTWGPFTKFSTLNAKSKGSAYNWGLYGKMKYINGKLRVGFLKRMSYNNDKYVYNNGFHYAYTNDPSGKTQWYNYKGEKFTLPLIQPEKIFFYEPGDVVTQGGANSVYISSGTDFTVTDQEAVHFITNNVKSNVDGMRRNVHAFKKEGDTEFTIKTNFPGGNLHAVEGNQVFLISNSNDRPVIYKAEGGTNNWEKLYTATSGISMEHSNVLIADGKLFVYAMQKATGDARPIYIQMYDLGITPVDSTRMITFKTPKSSEQFEFGEAVKVEANAGDSIKSLALLVDSVALRTIDNGEYIWGVDSIVDSELFYLSEGFHSLTLVGFNETDTIGEKTISIKVKKAPVPQGPYPGVAVAIPGTIEAENYDVGGEGVSYHDSDDINESALYRDDGVDIVDGGTKYSVEHTKNKEWQEYTIDVKEDGEYDFVVSYSSNLSSGTARISLSLPDEGKEIVSNYKLLSTYGWDNYWEETIATDVSLSKGKHVIRIDVVQFGFNLDWIKIKGDGVTKTKELKLTSVSVFPNPNSTGIFNLNRVSNYSVYSIEGLKVLSGKGRLIDIFSFPKGIYILKTETSCHKIVFK